MWSLRVRAGVDRYPCRLISDLQALLGGDEPRDVAERVQVIHASLVGLYLNVELLFEERHELEGGDRVEDTGGDQRGRVLQRIGTFVGQELVEDERLAGVLDENDLRHINFLVERRVRLASLRRRARRRGRRGASAVRSITPTGHRQFFYPQCLAHFFRSWNRTDPFWVPRKMMTPRIKDLNSLVLDQACCLPGQS